MEVILLKDFKDFSRLLNEEYFVQLASKINDLNLKTEVPTSQEGIQNFVGAILATTYASTLDLLEKYHHWMQNHEQ